MAKDLAGRGHSIVAIGIYDDELASTKVLLEGIPNVGEVLVIKTDLSDPSIENFEKLRKKIDPENRDIGILINNVGIYPTKVMRYNRWDMEYIRSMVNLNIMSTLHLTRMIMPGIIPKVSKTNGIESTPSPICVFIMRIDVPIHPTYVRCKDWCIMGNRDCNLHLGTIKSSCQHVVYCTTPGCALRLTFGPPS